MVEMALLPTLFGTCWHETHLIWNAAPVCSCTTVGRGEKARERSLVPQQNKTRQVKRLV